MSFSRALIFDSKVSSAARRRPLRYAVDRIRHNLDRFAAPSSAQDVGAVLLPKERPIRPDRAQERQLLVIGVNASRIVARLEGLRPCDGIAYRQVELQ